MSEGNQRDGVFTYTYSARQQEEVKAIRSKYIKQEESKLDQLRRLDRSVTQKGSACAIALGAISALVMGIGMCCTMVWAEKWFVPGIAIGVLGIAGVCLAYPVYMHVTRRERERIAPEILRLSEELMK
ncbi:MAG: hypothetical protein IJ313_06970 [Clostridia bacterium]|nr:hypothetical protein [Clostridia bacterium]